MPLSLRDALLEVAKSTGWGTIDGFCSALEGLDGFDWTETLKSDEHAIGQFKKTLVRRALKEFGNEHGLPVFESVVRTNEETGQEERVYKQEALFNVDDYRQTVTYYVGRANRHADHARRLADVAKVRFGVQIQLQFNVGDQDGTDG